MKKREISYYIIFGLLVFAGLFLFFSVLNPLVVYDTDDWLYIYETRKPIPLPHAWNPTRVFPETAMPAVSYFGALVINPIINNYFRSLMLAHALFASMVLTIYFVQFSVMFYKRKFASAKASIGYGCLFILLHFISHIFMGHDNRFLLGTYNLTCFYFYMLAAVINAILVMHFISYGGIKAWFRESNLLHKIVVVLWMYFCLNSNLFSSVVLATYVGTELLLNLLNEIKNKSFNLKVYCGSNWQNLLIIIYWFGANILETQGGRANDIGKSLIGNLPVTIVLALTGLLAINVFVLVVEGIVFFKWYKGHGKKLNNTAKRFVYYIGLELLYLILLSAKVEPSYIATTQVTVGIFFFIFMGLIACLNELIKEDRKHLRVLYILAGTLILLLIKPGNVLIPYNCSRLSYKQCEAVMNDFVEQVQTAEKEGKSDMVLEVPEYDSEDGNWPFCDIIGDRVAQALYRHKVVNTYIYVKEVKFSEEMTEKYGIDTSRR